MWAGTAVSLLSATTRAQHSLGSTWGSSRSPRELYQLHFPFRLGCSAPEESSTEGLLDT